MEFTAKQIAEFLNGEVVGDPDVSVSSVSGIEDGRSGALSFLANPKYEKYLYTTESSIVLINRDLKLEKEVQATVIRVDNAYDAFASLLQMYEQARPKPSGISSLSSIDPSARIGDTPYIGEYAVISKNTTLGNNVRIYPQVYIGEKAVIGDNTVLYPGVKIYHDCVIGAGCIIHSGTVIGSDGFGFASQEGGAQYNKIPQLGNVVIEDDVELGSNVSVDRATMGSTIIRKGVKLDNLVQVAHNVEIGEHTIIVSQAGIAGSTKIGARCMLGGQVGIIGHLTVADDVKIGAQAGVSNSINTPGEILLGSPATKISEQRRSMVIYKKLPELYALVNKLEKEVEDLKKR